MRKYKGLVIFILGLFLIFIALLFLKKENIKLVLDELKLPYREVRYTYKNFKDLKEIKNQIKEDIKNEEKIEKEYTKLFYDFENPYIKVNPYGRNPLSVIIKFETEAPSSVKVVLKNKSFAKKDYIQRYDKFTKEHIIYLGYLYADTENIIELIIEEEDGGFQKKEHKIKTESLMSRYPVIVQKKINNDLKDFILLEYGAYGESQRLGLIIDTDGNIRGGLETGNYFQNILINKNKNFVWAKNNKIYEYNILGKLIKVIDTKNYNAHHDIYEKSDGNYLVTVSKKGSILERKNEKILTIEDYIIEIDKSGNIIKEWDFKKILDTNRQVIANLREDWLHINSVFFDEEKKEIIISANFQGIFAVDYDGNLKWILSDPVGYNEIFKEKLLSKDEVNLNFRFPYGQHEARKLDNGNILVFDNNAIHFDFDNQLNPKLKKLIPENNQYSRIVEYKIDSEKMKVYQEFEYYDKKLWSKTISGVKKYGNSYLIAYGHLIDQNKNMYGKVRKINENREIEYDFDIIYRDNEGAALYRSQILNLD